MRLTRLRAEVTVGRREKLLLNVRARGRPADHRDRLETVELVTRRLSVLPIEEPRERRRLSESDVDGTQDSTFRGRRLQPMFAGSTFLEPDVNQVSTAAWGFTGPAAPPLPGAGATMRQVHVKAGHVAARHSHPHEQFLLVLSGAATLECEAGTIAFEPGVAVRFAPGAWHSAVFVEDTMLVEFNLAE